MKSALKILAGMLDERIAFVGRAGTGKTNAAKVGVEALLDDDARVCILDPTDAWYGLRLGRDRAASGYDVVIFGGDHGDLPLNAQAGATIGEAIAKSESSCIVSFAGFATEGERRRFATELLEALYHHNRASLHLIVDEADTFAPQKPITPGDNVLLARMNAIVRRGRVRGFVPWLISQRPAVINKDVLSQADALVALNLTSSQDRDAIGRWIEGQADTADAKAMLASLARLQRGEALIWHPSANVLERAAFPLAATYDSGRTPKRGEKISAAKLKPIDVGALSAAVASVVAEKEANDPTLLKKKLAEIQRELAAEKAKAAKDLAGPTPEALKHAANIAYSKGNKDGFARAMAIGAGLAQAVKEAESARVTANSLWNAEYQAIEKAGAKGNGAAPAPIEADHAGKISLPPGRTVKPADYDWNTGGDSSLSKADRALLTVLAQFRGPVEAKTLAAIAGYAVNGGSFRTYISRLKTAERIFAGQPYRITAKGLADLGAYEPLPTGRALLDHWRSRVGKSEGAILHELAERGGSGTPADISEAVGIAMSGGSWRTYLSRLRTLCLVTTAGGSIELHESLR